MNDSRSVKKVWQARMTGKRKRASKKNMEKFNSGYFKKKMLHGMRQVKKCEIGRNGQSLCINKRNNT